MSSTKLVQHINAPRSTVYRTFVDSHLVVEFETADPALQGEMTITIELCDANGGTDVVVAHDHLPPGLSAADNDAGSTLSLKQLAILMEFERPYQRQKLATVPGVALLTVGVVVGLSYRLDLLTAPIPVVGWTLFWGIVLWGGFTMWNWRCPACRAHPGNKISLVVCKHCGARLRP